MTSFTREKSGTDVTSPSFHLDMMAHHWLPAWHICGHKHNGRGAGVQNQLARRNTENMRPMTNIYASKRCVDAIPEVIKTAL